MDERLYLLFEDYRIGYIREICNCNQCKERGESECLIYEPDEKYMDCIKLSKLTEDVKNGVVQAVGYTINEIMKDVKDIISRKESQINSMSIICDYYRNQLDRKENK